MAEKLPTCGQLERNLSQQILTFYRERLGHKPSKIICQLFEQRATIIIEDSLTPAEQLLAKDGQQELAQDVRSCLDELTKPQITQLIEATLEVKVIDLLSDATLETGRTGMIVILETSPRIRNPEGRSAKSQLQEG